jgi:hypothetical protein
MIVPGVEQESRTEWRNRCGELADAFGWKRKIVWDWFQQFALARAFHSVSEMTFDVHQDGAWRDCLAVIDKRGAAPD